MLCLRPLTGCSCDVQVALSAWEHLIRGYLPASEAPSVKLGAFLRYELSPAERQADTDFISPVVSLICSLYGRAIDAGYCSRGHFPSPGRLDRCQLLTEVCLLLATLLGAGWTSMGYLYVASALSAVHLHNIVAAL